MGATTWMQDQVKAQRRDAGKHARGPRRYARVTARQATGRERDEGWAAAQERRGTRTIGPAVWATEGDRQQVNDSFLSGGAVGGVMRVPGGGEKASWGMGRDGSSSQALAFAL